MRCMLHKRTSERVPQESKDDMGEEGLSSDAFTLLCSHVIATCENSIEVDVLSTLCSPCTENHCPSQMCQNVELQRRILLSQYTVKLESVNMKEFWYCTDLGFPFLIASHCSSKLGFESRVHFVLVVDCPTCVKVCSELLKPAMCNAVQNAQEHGQQGSRVTILVSFDEPTAMLSVQITNKPGKNHLAMMKLQTERGIMPQCSPALDNGTRLFLQV